MFLFAKRKNKLNKEKNKWQEQKKLLEEEIALKQQKVQFFEDNKIIKKPKISTTKKIVMFLFINCSLIELFTGFITLANLHLNIQTGALIDFTPIVTLIGAVVSQVIGFAIYAVKATKENTQGGVIYETAMQNFYSSEESKSQEGGF